MTSKFVREERYFVIKLADIEKYLPSTEKDRLNFLKAVTNAGRIREGKKKLEGMFIEKDWPEYEPTWKAIEARVTGAQPTPSVPENKK